MRLPVLLVWCGPLLLQPAVAPLTAKPAVQRVPTGHTTPRSWLLRQLIIQAEGLSGHLTAFWPKVQHSAWFGGNQPFYTTANVTNACGDGPCPKHNNISQTDLLHQVRHIIILWLLAGAPCVAKLMWVAHATGSQLLAEWVCAARGPAAERAHHGAAAARRGPAHDQTHPPDGAVRQLRVVARGLIAVRGCKRGLRASSCRVVRAVRLGIGRQYVLG